MLLKTSMYVKRYEGQTKWMYFLIEDNDLMNYTTWDNVNTDISKEFDSKPNYNKTFLKTQIKSYGDGDEPTNLHNKEMPKACSNHICLAVITILLLKKSKIIIHKCFEKNANTWKKK